MAAWRRLLAIAGVLAVLISSGCAAMRRAPKPDLVAKAKQTWLRGVSALESGRLGEAETLLREAAEATPDDPQAQRHLAEALWRRGERAEALAHAEQACLCAPMDAASAVRAGQMRLSEGDDETARQWAEHAVATDTSSSDAWALRGRIYQQRGDTDRALADLQQALRYAPSDPQILTDIALLHSVRGDHRRCLTTLHHLIETHPPGQEPAGALALAGESYLALGRAQDASDALRLAATRGEVGPDLLCKLAEAEAACGHTTEALAGARRALDLDAAHQPSRELIARLETTDSLR